MPDHTSLRSQDLNDSFGLDVIGHPPYSSDLAPSDFHVFCHLKHEFGGRHFDNDEDEVAVTTWLSEQALNSVRMDFKT